MVQAHSRLCGYGSGKLGEEIAPERPVKTLLHTARHGKEHILNFTSQVSRTWLTIRSGETSS